MRGPRAAGRSVLGLLGQAIVVLGGLAVLCTLLGRTIVLDPVEEATNRGWKALASSLTEAVALGSWGAAVFLLQIAAVIVCFRAGRLILHRFRARTVHAASHPGHGRGPV
ncbi:hypothetical protein ACFXOS_19275 [Streptomyces sp. NPDC059175]|uniref:hypothetical protein n=1 Tax=Streptomyces sp. NPDC059175 TaxID=3346757 RepID=UPI0036BCF24D